MDLKDRIVQCLYEQGHDIDTIAVKLGLSYSDVEGRLLAMCLIKEEDDYE